VDSTAALEREADFSRDALAYAGLTVATLGWASAFVAGKVVMAEMTPLVASAWRYAVAAVILLPFAVRDLRPHRLRALLVPFGILLLCGGIIYPWCFLSSLKFTSATNSALLIALNPVFTVLAAPLVGERLTAHRLTGVLVALAGAVIVITHGEVSRLLGLSLNRGDVLALGAALTWAVFNLIGRRVVLHLSPAAINCLVYVFGGVALAAIGFSEGPLQQLLSASRAALSGILVMSVLASVLAGQLFLLGLRGIGVSRSVVFIYLVPVLTAALSALMLDEAVTLPQVAGGTAVLVGVYLSSRAGGGGQ
jgi:drug/metabolite transporter (DMT)-like permease